MENKKPLVLISNDDGYHANGIKTLVSFLKDWCDLLVVAPVFQKVHQGLDSIGMIAIIIRN